MPNRLLRRRGHIDGLQWKSDFDHFLTVGVSEHSFCVRAGFSQHWCEFWRREDDPFKESAVDLTLKFAARPFLFRRDAQIELPFFGPLAFSQNRQVLRPAEISQQCCEIWQPSIGLEILTAAMA
ncbi:MAG: hypothetical protein O3A00_01565 [Planctomycetota bacterium]|nr:hypothetical protein [Planctomycetota bacterium]